jgi:hypothetical protein
VNRGGDGTLSLIVTGFDHHAIDLDRVAIEPESLYGTVEVTPKLLAQLVKLANGGVELSQLVDQLGRMTANVEGNARGAAGRRRRQILEARAQGIALAAEAAKARLDRVQR